MLLTIVLLIAFVWCVSVFHLPLKLTLVSIFGGLYVLFWCVVYVSCIYALMALLIYGQYKLRSML
jgi:hypothetical protein